MKNGLMAKVYYVDGNSFDYIPTYGLPCSVIDLYRVAEFVNEGFLTNNPGFISYKDYNNISIFENEIKSFEDILKFESSLRFILLTDEIYFLQPSIKYFNEDTKRQSYERPKDFANESANLIYRSIGAFDFLFPHEKVIIKNNKVVSSTDNLSEFINFDFSTIKQKLINNKRIDSFLHSIPPRLSTPFISNNSEKLIEGNVIINDYLKSLDENFYRNIEYSIKFGYNVPLPFFTNSVLGISKNRDDIPMAILKLRDELDGLRTQLFEYQDKLKGIDSIKDQAILQKDIKSAINIYSNGIYRGDTFTSDTIRLIAQFVKNPADLLIKSCNVNYSIKNEFPIVFGNSNYKRLRKLISKDNINTNIYNFLTKKEIKNISN